jgi:endonuclease/exonuclease/phosphatase family metal-dependent hydrolase
MQMLSRRFCLLLLWTVLLPVFLAGAGERLRVVALNAEWFPGRVPQPAPAQQARHIVGMQKLLHDLNPDILLLQEIVRVEALPKAFAVLPDLVLYTVSAFTNNPLQLAIAGRLPLVAADVQAWPSADARGEQAPPRGIGQATVALPDGGLLLVFTLHLKSNWRGDEDYDEKKNVRMREAAVAMFMKSVAVVERRFARQSVRGVLLGGDLNTLYPSSLYRGEKTVSLLEAGGFKHLGSNGLDHFWGKGISNAVFSVFTDFAVSDHAPIILDLAMRADVAITRLPVREPASVAALAGNVRTDINKASRAELMSLPGIGPVLAQRIVERRPFASIDDMAALCGIGPRTLARILPYSDVRAGD